MTDEFDTGFDSETIVVNGTVIHITRNRLDNRLWAWSVPDKSVKYSSAKTPSGTLMFGSGYLTKSGAERHAKRAVRIPAWWDDEYLRRTFR